MSNFKGAFKGALDGVKDIAMGVKEKGEWYYEDQSTKKKYGPFPSLEAAKKAAIAKGYDW